MRRLLFILGVAAAIPVVLFLTWDTQTRTLGNALIADVSTTKQKTIKRDPEPRSPMHENGFQCLGSMLDVTPGDFGPFGAKNVGSLEPFISGAKPVTEVPPEIRTSMLTFSPWAGSMRGCGDSKQLTWVEGLSPWAPQTNARRVRLAEAMPALIEFTALELRVLIADGQPEVALERCSATWGLAADQTHLGKVGAVNARLAVKRLAPACGDALNAVPPEVKAQLAKQWSAIESRLAAPRELVEAERLNTSLRTFAWVSDEAIRAQLPGLTMSSDTAFMNRVNTGRSWRAWDTAMRKLISVADVAGAERQQAADGVEALVPSQFATVLNEYEQTGALLDAMAAMASAPKSP
jgi:hypothetical protein